jgi:hypothetical protein
MWSAEQFVRALEPHVERYKTDNAWVSWWSDEDIDNAWRMYSTSSTSSLGFLLLGDTKIRKDETLLMNFGTATAHDIQEVQERALVAELSDRRRVISHGTAPDIHYEAAKGPGSILSDDKWTPMLNDSFMLGGIHAGMDFHLAEDFFQSRTARLQDQTPMTKWKYFFRDNPASFWSDRFGPRVFARECIGLKSAGYTPHFAHHGLVFVGGGGPGSLDFASYLQAVTDYGLTSRDKTLALRTIAEFLFNDRDALS